MVDAQLLTRGQQLGVAIGIGATVSLLGQNPGTPAAPDNRIYCGGDDELTVEVDMTGGAVGDLGVTCLPYASDNATVIPSPLPAISAPAVNPVFVAGHVYWVAKYDVSGQEMVRIDVKNNNVAGQTITRASWRLS